MRRLMIIASSMLALTVGSVGAQEFSERGDRALWCNMELELMTSLGAFSEADDVAARAASEEHAVVVMEEIAAAGMAPRDFEVMSNALWSEVEPAVDTYVASKDATGLRFDVEDCLKVE